MATYEKPMHLPSICHGVDEPCEEQGKWRRQNTAYVDDKGNWVFMCDSCASINDEYWEEMWDEYYSGRL